MHKSRAHTHTHTQKVVCGGGVRRLREPFFSCCRRGAYYAVDITQQAAGAGGHRRRAGLFEIKIAYTLYTLGDRISLRKRPNEDLG